MPKDLLTKFHQRLDSLKIRDQSEEIIDFLRPLAHKFTDDYFIMKELSLAYLNADHPKEALLYGKKAMAIDCHVPSVWEACACALLNNHHYDEAIELYNKILSKSVSDIAYGPHGEGLKWAQSMYIDSIFRIALCYDGKDNFQDAIRLVKLHLSKRKRGIYSDFKKKDCLKYLKELEYFSKIVPKIQATKNDEKLALLKAGEKWEDIIDLLQPLADKYSNDYYILTELSWAQHNIKRYKEALHNVEKAMKIESHDVYVWDAYACALLYNDQYDDAIEWYNKILRMSVPDIAYGPHGEGLKWAQSIHTDAFFWKAYCYNGKGDYAEARRLTKLHIRKRQKGVFSNFSKKEVLKFLKKIEEHLLLHNNQPTAN